MTRGFASNPRPVSGHVILVGTSIKETDKAILFKILEISGLKLVTPAQEWFPISQMLNRKINPPSDVASTEDQISVSRWIYDTKGLDKLARHPPGFVDTEDPMDEDLDDQDSMEQDMEDWGDDIPF